MALCYCATKEASRAVGRNVWQENKKHTALFVLAPHTFKTYDLCLRVGKKCILSTLFTFKANMTLKYELICIYQDMQVCRLLAFAESFLFSFGFVFTALFPLNWNSRASPLFEASGHQYMEQKLDQLYLGVFSRVKEPIEAFACSYRSVKTLLPFFFFFFLKLRIILTSVSRGVKNYLFCWLSTSATMAAAAVYSHNGVFGGLLRTTRGKKSLLTMEVHINHFIGGFKCD